MSDWINAEYGCLRVKRFFLSGAEVYSLTKFGYSDLFRNAREGEDLILSCRGHGLPPDATLIRFVIPFDRLGYDFWVSSSEYPIVPPADVVAEEDFPEEALNHLRLSSVEKVIETVEAPSVDLPT